MGEERRHPENLNFRSLIAGLEKRLDLKYRAIGQRMMWRITVMMLTVAASWGLGIGYVVKQQRDAQESRRVNLVRACLDRNEEHAAIVRFIVRQDRRLRVSAEREFPLTRDCGRYAEQRLQAR